MWKKILSKNVFNHSRLSLIEDEVLLPNGEKVKYLKFKDDGSCGVTVITKRKDEKILVQKEYSYPSNKKLYQFPGGMVLKDEDVLKGANRELMEESSLKAHNIKYLGSYLINNRRSTARMNVVLATELEEKSLEGDLEEDIENYWFTEKEILGMIKNNEIINSNLLAAWSIYTVFEK